MFDCFDKDDTTGALQIHGCPNNITTTTELGTTSKSISWTEPTATDRSGTPTRVRSHQPGAEFPLGVTSVRYTFTDASDNPVTCDFTITLESGYSLFLQFVCYNRAAY